MTKKTYVVAIGIGILLLSILTPAVMAEGKSRIVELQCSFPGLVVEAGDVATFELNIINNGPAGTFTLRSHTYIDQQDWNVKFYSGETEVYRVFIPEGGSARVTASVETPGDAKEGEYQVRIDVWDDTFMLFVKLSRSHAGETGTVTVELVDKDGNAVKGAVVNVTKSGHPVEQVMTTADGRASIPVPKGTYDVSIEKGGYRTVVKKSIAVRTGQSTELGLITVDKENYYTDFIIKSPEKTVTLEKTPEFEVTLKNEGRCEDSYRLGVEDLPNGWYARYREADGSGDEVQEINLAAGEERAFTLEVITPYYVDPGEYDLVAVAEGSTQEYRVPLVLRIRGYTEMQVYSGRYSYNVNKGDPLSIDLVIVNAGNAVTLSNITVEVKAPAGWTAVIEPKSLVSLDQGDSEDVTLEIIPAANIIASEYRIEVVVRSDQAEETVDYRIEVKEQSLIGIMGLLLIILSACGVWWMFRKYGRR